MLFGASKWLEYSLCFLFVDFHSSATNGKPLMTKIAQSKDILRNYQLNTLHCQLFS